MGKNTATKMMIGRQSFICAIFDNTICIEYAWDLHYVPSWNLENSSTDPLFLNNASIYSILLNHRMKS